MNTNSMPVWKQTSRAWSKFEEETLLGQAKLSLFMSCRHLEKPIPSFYFFGSNWKICGDEPRVFWEILSGVLSKIINKLSHSLLTRRHCTQVTNTNRLSVKIRIKISDCSLKSEGAKQLESCIRPCKATPPPQQKNNNNKTNKNTLIP